MPKWCECFIRVSHCQWNNHPTNLVYVCWPSNYEFFTFMLTYLLIRDFVCIVLQGTHHHYSMITAIDYQYMLVCTKNKICNFCYWLSQQNCLKWLKLNWSSTKQLLYWILWNNQLLVSRELSVSSSLSSLYEVITNYVFSKRVWIISKCQ